MKGRDYNSGCFSKSTIIPQVGTVCLHTKPTMPQGLQQITDFNTITKPTTTVTTLVQYIKYTKHVNNIATSDTNTGWVWSVVWCQIEIQAWEQWALQNNYVSKNKNQRWCLAIWQWLVQYIDPFSCLSIAALRLSCQALEAVITCNLFPFFRRTAEYIERGGLLFMSKHLLLFSCLFILCLVHVVRHVWKGVITRHAVIEGEGTDNQHSLSSPLYMIEISQTATQIIIKQTCSPSFWNIQNCSTNTTYAVHIIHIL